MWKVGGRVVAGRCQAEYLMFMKSGASSSSLHVLLNHEHKICIINNFISSEAIFLLATKLVA